MSSRSSVLSPEPPATKEPLLRYYPERKPSLSEILLASPNVGGCTTNGRPWAGGEVDAVPFARIIAKLSPEHRRIIEAMVRELAKLEGIEGPAISESEPEPLGHYIPAWQNSLATRGFSLGSMGLYRYNVERLLAAVSPPVTSIAIEEYIASRREKGISPTALKNDLKAAKSLFAFLHERGVIASDPTAKLRHPKIEKREKICPTEDEVAKFLPVLAEAKNPRAKLMLLLFINTGIRFTELVTLTWGRVNLEEREITVRGKGGKWRKVPIALQVRDFLAKLHKGHGDSEMLFPTESKGGKWDNSDANKMIARLCRKAGIKRYTCHQFRHFFATHMRKAGAPLKVIQELLGHVSSAITLDFYDHTDEEEIRKTHEAFAPLSEGLLPKEDKGGSSDGQTD